jgi:hypothetical protein
VLVHLKDERSLAKLEASHDRSDALVFETLVRYACGRWGYHLELHMLMMNMVYKAYDLLSS